MVPLVFGYVLGNESKDVHEACNEFTNEALPNYDIPTRVDVSDGDKGQKKGLSERYSHKRTDLEACVSKYTDLGV